MTLHLIAIAMLLAALTALGGAEPDKPGDDNWLTPLAVAAAEPLAQQPGVQAADIQRQRSRLQVNAALSAWGVQLTSTGLYGENRHQSTSVIDGSGVVVDRNTVANVGLAKAFDTGTNLSVQASSNLQDSTSPQFLAPQIYTSNVAVVINQALLDGNNRTANDLEETHAWTQFADDQDNYLNQRETQFVDLAKQWLDLAQKDADLTTRRARLGKSRHNLELVELRAKEGLGKALDLLSLRRDVATQEAAVAQAERARDTVRESLHLGWAKLALPDGSALSLPPPVVTIRELGYAQTRAGLASLRHIRAAAIDLAAAQAVARDRFDLQLTYGQFGTDTTLSQSWQQVANDNTFRWTAGLTYVHRFGADRERVSAIQAGLGLEQVRRSTESDELAWRVTRGQLRQALFDASARVAEQQKLLDAFHEELRLTGEEAKAGLIPITDLLNLQRQIDDTELALHQACLDVRRAEIDLRAHEDTVLEMLP